ncbi:uncharacterized protein CLUP02_14486 [Colletotrichum lupini]|uniref:Uncharacterized protein n=1 Tax=Colletotrichum lupini TaxID=145971 RepID=A0A9Q8WMN3_9PEZI|nr:uncharacterized protein CLUP02_14486 [Colletotrichum lupini]UQC88959.1 hypothetical protein CLUP02_14486 [Colletotrichum lupini]
MAAIVAKDKVTYRDCMVPPGTPGPSYQKQPQMLTCIHLSHGKLEEAYQFKCWMSTTLFYQNCILVFVTHKEFIFFDNKVLRQRLIADPYRPGLDSWADVALYLGSVPSARMIQEMNAGRGALSRYDMEEDSVLFSRQRRYALAGVELVCVWSLGFWRYQPFSPITVDKPIVASRLTKATSFPLILTLIFFLTPLSFVPQSLPDFMCRKLYMLL